MAVRHDTIPRDMATCPLHEIDPLDPALAQDPHPYFRRLREEAPVYRDPKTGIVYVSTYEMIVKVNTQPFVFSNDFAKHLNQGTAEADPEEEAINAQGLPRRDTLLTADPPAHTRYRKLAMRAFTFKRVEGMGDYIAEVTHGLIDKFIADGACDFKAAFADFLPSVVIADAMGVPRSDLDQFHIWLQASVTRLGGHMSSREARLAAARQILELQNYFIKKIAEKRANPTEDVISDLVHANLGSEGDPRQMDDAELYSIIDQLFVAGQETTANTATAGLYYLLTHPEQFERVKADPSLVQNFVEESLRYLTPVNNMWRRVVKDTELGGVPVKAGDMMLLRYGSAGRDDAKFPNPDVFDIDRPNAKEHFAFGSGIHSCIGAQLARKEMNIAFPILFERLTNLRLAPGNNDVRYSQSPVLRGVDKLYIQFDKGKARST